MATASFLFAIGTHVPAKTIAEFIQLAKAKPGTINYGSSGPASVQRLQMEYFAVLTGVQMTHVPFKGANETVMAMLANQMDASISASSNVLPHLPTGRLRALAVTTAQRSAQAPDVPTMQEAGVPEFDTYSMFGLFAPARTSQRLLRKFMRTSPKSCVAQMLSALWKHAVWTCKVRMPLNFRRSSKGIRPSGEKVIRPRRSKTSKAFGIRVFYWALSEHRTGASKCPA